MITSSLRAITFFQFSFGSTTSIPYSPACFRWSHTSAENSIALVGMHPHSRHVPPSRSFASISADFQPILRARESRTYTRPARRPPPPHQKSSPPTQAPIHAKMSQPFNFTPPVNTHPTRPTTRVPHDLRQLRSANSTPAFLSAAELVPRDACDHAVLPSRVVVQVDLRRV